MFCPIFTENFRGAHPHYIQNYFLLGSGRISRITLEMSKHAEFHGSAELLHVCNQTVKLEPTAVLIK